MLECLGGPNVITRVLIKERGAGRRVREGRCDDGSGDQSDTTLLV